MEMAMICNLSWLDRTIRISMGTVFLALGAFGSIADLASWILGLSNTMGLYALLSGWIRGLLYTMGLYALLSGVVGFCPAYKVFGMNTRMRRMDVKG